MTRAWSDFERKPLFRSDTKDFTFKLMLLCTHFPHSRGSLKSIQRVSLKLRWWFHSNDPYERKALHTEYKSYSTTFHSMVVTIVPDCIFHICSFVSIRLRIPFCPWRLYRFIWRLLSFYTAHTVSMSARVFVCGLKFRCNAWIIRHLGSRHKRKLTEWKFVCVHFRAEYTRFETEWVLFLWMRATACRMFRRVPPYNRIWILVQSSTECISVRLSYMPNATSLLVLFSIDDFYVVKCVNGIRVHVSTSWFLSNFFEDFHWKMQICG